MSILIKPVQRTNPGKPDAAKKWYLVQNSTGLVDEATVADLLAEETTLNPMEAMLAVRQLRKIVVRLLKDGHSVHLGNMGTLSVTLSSRGADTKEELTVAHIQKVNIHFQPNAEVDAQLQKVEFLRIDKAGKHR